MSERASAPNSAESIQIAESIRNLFPKNAQLLGKTALRLSEKVLESADRYNEFKDDPAPFSSFLLSREKKILDDRLNVLAQEDYDVEEEIRKPLAEAPDFVKNAQNKIFSKCVIDEENGFIARNIKPEEKGEYNVFARIMAALNGAAVPKTHYDFVGRLTEKDEAGNYVIPDNTVKNFVSWYHAKVAEGSERFTREVDNHYSLFMGQFDAAINSGALPGVFRENFDRLNGIKIEYGVVDAVNAYKNNAGEFFAIGGYCSKAWFDKDVAIGLGSEHIDDIGAIVSHELTHAMAGDKIEFGDNQQATRIINEGLTESISAIINNVEIETDDLDLLFAQALVGKNKDELTPFDGETYENERKVLQFLSSDGKHKIDPEEFYAAYAEVDEEYERIRDGDSFDVSQGKPRRTYGPSQQKLINDLLESFPDCKDLAGLGDLIVTKYREFKQR